MINGEGPMPLLNTFETIAISYEKSNLHSCPLSAFTFHGSAERYNAEHLQKHVHA